MARKAPKNPINDIVDTVGAWFGGRGPGTNPQVSRVSRDLGRAVSAADTVTGGFGAAALRDVKKFQQGGSLPTNLAKTAAVNVAAGAVGAKAAQVAGRAVAKTGVAARVANKLTGQTVVLHGTGEVLKNPKTGVPYRFNAQGKPLDKGAYLEPRAGSPALPDTPAVFGWNPKNLDGYGNVENQLQIYSSQARNFGYGTQSADFVPQKQVVIGKAKTKTVRPQGTNTAIQEVLGPVKIKQIVKTDLPMMDYYDQLGLAAKRAGAKTSHPTYKDKLERSVKQAIQKRKDRKNTSL